MKPKYRIPAKVLWLLHDRGLTVSQLAALVQSGRTHVNQVLGNAPERGHHTRRKLARHLTDAERALLGWGPLGELLHVERHIPKENEKRTAK